MDPVLAITGTSGFVASACVSLFAKRGIQCVSLRRGVDIAGGSRSIGRLDGSPISSTALIGCTVIIHAAARAHILCDNEPDPLNAFRLANTASTLCLAKAAIAAGVGRFVFISSIGVLGNHSTGHPLRPSDNFDPIENYARSKAEAEEGLRLLCESAGMELVIIRPPLVHGPGAKGNFQRLMEVIHAGKVLPLGGVCNRRSFVGVGNLAEALLVAATAPWPGSPTVITGGPEVNAGYDFFVPSDKADIVGRNQATLPMGFDRTVNSKKIFTRTYHIADDGVISTRRLVEVLAEGMGLHPRLINVPRWLAVGGAALLGKGAMAKRLLNDLEVDDADFRRDFSWRPSIGLEDGLRMMAADFVRRIGHKAR